MDQDRAAAFQRLVHRQQDFVKDLDVRPGYAKHYGIEAR